MVEDVKSHLSEWCELSVPAEKKQKILIYLTKNGEEDVTNLLMPKTKAEEKAVDKQSKKNIRLVTIPNFVAYNHSRKSK